MAEKNNITINLTELKAALFDKCVTDIAKKPDDNCYIVATNMLVAGEIIIMIERLDKGC